MCAQRACDITQFVALVSLFPIKRGSAQLDVNFKMRKNSHRTRRMKNCAIVAALLVPGGVGGGGGFRFASIRDGRESRLIKFQIAPPLFLDLRGTSFEEASRYARSFDLHPRQLTTAAVTKIATAIARSRSPRLVARSHRDKDRDGKGHALYVYARFTCIGKCEACENDRRIE